MESSHSQEAPFRTVRLVEVGNSIPVMFAGMLFADLGADVIRLEHAIPSAQTTVRAERVYNRGKRSVSPKGLSWEEILALARGADAVLTDGGAAVVPKLPHHIYCELPVFPEGTHPAAWGEDPLLVDAYAGLLDSVRTWRGGPGFLEQPEGAVGAGVLAAISLASGLLVRERCGRGQTIEVSWLAGALSIQMFNMVAPADGDFAFEWEEADPRGWLPTFRLYKGADDKWFYIACPNPVFWVKLCLALGREDLATDERYENSPYVPDKAAREELKETLETTFFSRTADEWVARLEEFDLICGPVLTRRQWMEHQQTAANGMRVEIDDPILGPTVQPGVSVAPSVRELRPAPVPGSEELSDVLEAWTPRQFEVTGTPPSTPLEGVRVIDLANYAAGALAPKILADLGADVIKVETLSGDPFRQIGLGFAVTNRGKRAISVDLDTAPGREVMRRLMVGAEALVTNLRPAALHALGLTDAEAHRTNEDLVYVAASGFGWSGPWRDKPCVDLAVQAVTGWSAAQGGDQSPTAPGPWPFDNFTPHLLALAVVAGLLGKSRGDKKIAVKTSMVSVAMTMQAEKFLFSSGTMDGAHLTPDSYGFNPGYRLYRTADGWILLAAQQDREIKTVIELLCAEQPESNEQLERVLESAFAYRTSGELLDMLQKAGIACGPVLSRRAAMSDETITGSGLVVIREHPSLGRLIQTGNLAKFSLTPTVIGSAAPGLGKDTDEILREMGYGSPEIRKLREAGAVK